MGGRHRLEDFGPDELLIVGRQAVITAPALAQLAHYAASEPTSPSPGRVWRATRPLDEQNGKEYLRWVEADPDPEYVLTHTVEAFVVPS